MCGCCVLYTVSVCIAAAKLDFLSTGKWSSCKTQPSCLCDQSSKCYIAFKKFHYKEPEAVQPIILQWRLLVTQDQLPRCCVALSYGLQYKYPLRELNQSCIRERSTHKAMWCPAAALVWLGVVYRCDTTDCQMIKPKTQADRGHYPWGPLGKMVCCSCGLCVCFLSLQFCVYSSAHSCILQVEASCQSATKKRKHEEASEWPAYKAEVLYSSYREICSGGIKH